MSDTDENQEIRGQRYDRRVLDVSDRCVREMAEHNHQPDELWDVAGRLIGVHCRTCHQSWPCRTRKALTKWRDEDPRKGRQGR